MSKTKVFISYSHEDEEWKDRLVTHLKVLKLQGILELWDDRLICAGEDWYEEIHEAIDAACVAILLISADYLSSTFILNEEIRRLLQRRKENGLQVFPIIVKPCAWDEVDWLARMQARPKDGRPLSAGNENQIDADLATIAKEIHLLLRTEKPNDTVLPNSLTSPVIAAPKSIAESIYSQKSWLGHLFLISGALALLVVPLFKSWEYVKTLKPIKNITQPIPISTEEGTPELPNNLSRAQPKQPPTENMKSRQGSDLANARRRLARTEESNPGQSIDPDIEELVDILNFRASQVLETMEQEKQKALDRVRAGVMTNVGDGKRKSTQEFLQEIEATRKLFSDLHQKHIEAIKQRHFILAHEIVSDIHELLWIRSDILTDAQSPRRIHALGYKIEDARPPYPGRWPDTPVKKYPKQPLEMWLREQARLENSSSNINTENPFGQFIKTRELKRIQLKEQLKKIQ